MTDDSAITSKSQQDELQFVFNNGKLTVSSLYDKIKTVTVLDIFTPAIGTRQLNKKENINSNTVELDIDKKIKIILIKVELENGTVTTKKMIQ